MPSADVIYWLRGVSYANRLRRSAPGSIVVPVDRNRSPQTRACPIAFLGGGFWNNPEKLSLTVKNIGQKPITHLAITSEIFLAPQDLRRPASFQWSSTTTIVPGAEQSIDKPGIPPASAQKILGWVFFPSSVKDADGTEWTPKSEGECFQVIWRDEEHPDVPALPPRQYEINAD